MCDSWLLHVLCNSTSSKISEHFKLFPQRLQKLGGRSCRKLAKNVSFFKYLEKLLFGIVSKGQKLFNHYAFYTAIAAQLRNHSLKIFSHSDHICRFKGVKVTQSKQNCTKTRCTNTFAPGNLSRLSQITFFLTKQKAIYQVCGLNFSFML